VIHVEKTRDASEIGATTFTDDVHRRRSPTTFTDDVH